MALKNICRIPPTWTLEEYSLHNCQDGSHDHLSRAEIREYVQEGRVVWLREAKTRRESSVVWILPSQANPTTKNPCAAGPMNAGLSFRVGETLAIAVYRHQSWAEVMLSHIQMRREESTPIPGPAIAAS